MDRDEHSLDEKIESRDLQPIFTVEYLFNTPGLAFLSHNM